MLKLAVFGHPVSGSKSPAIHARFATATGLDIDYRAIDCPAGGLRQALAAFAEAGGHGCNLTVPLKAEGLQLAASASDAARDAGACNTLVHRNGSWQADNTDGAGLTADLDRLDITIAGRRMLVIGAGGAVAGVLGPLLAKRPDRVTIANRSLDKAAALAERFQDRETEIDSSPFDQLASTGPFDVIIQGTSLGHRGEIPALPDGIAAPDAVAYDLNYGAAFEPFRAWCDRHGIVSHGGRGMLIEQAALAFERFTGFRPNTAALHALEEL
jgi:shikimate dehydrogenase